MIFKVIGIAIFIYFQGFDIESEFFKVTTNIRLMHLIFLIYSFTCKIGAIIQILKYDKQSKIIK